MQARKKVTAPIPRRHPRTPFAVFTVDAILAAVEQILEHDGPDQLTTNRVAELAGVSIGTLYQYFPNKNALVGAIQDRYTQDTLGRVRAAIDGTEALPIRDVITKIAQAVMAATVAQRPIHRWLIDWRTPAGSWERYRAGLDQLVGVIADYLARRADLAIGDPRAAAFVIVHACEGIIEAVSERLEHVDAPLIAAHAVAMIAAFVAV